ncbi:ornithine lipid N-methyltransferase [Paludisphaera rhizosphaerae]|uniref:ornithine lipid N-methyltransferase n=1 Tax=Paludisphaera rhizosphaerae TaxID=2711216 RepID=UPI0013EB6991|nr:ornithine lipid N-methyltransferase [Paludisphaera rhizosphaerae]
MSDFILFLGKFLRHGTAIASLAPSSRWLAQATVSNIDWSIPNVIVELGAGTGPITRVLAERSSPVDRVLVVERDPDFARMLRDRFGGLPNLELIEGDARDLAGMLHDRGIDRVDHVVSGLPTPSLPKDVQRELIRVVGQVLKPEGTFNQITEMPWVYRGLYRRLFEDVQFHFEPRNFPPAGVYICRGVRPPVEAL